MDPIDRVVVWGAIQAGFFGILCVLAAVVGFILQIIEAMQTPPQKEGANVKVDAVNSEGECPVSALSNCEVGKTELSETAAYLSTSHLPTGQPVPIAIPLSIRPIHRHLLEEHRHLTPRR